MPPMLTTEQAKRLAEELTSLSKQQSLALQTSAYHRMTEIAAANYDARRLRIAEICTQLAEFCADV